MTLAVRRSGLDERIIALQDGPVILVGHSWGGAVITEAGNDPKVAALVYVAAYARRWDNPRTMPVLRLVGPRGSGRSECAERSSLR